MHLIDIVEIIETIPIKRSMDLISSFLTSVRGLGVGLQGRRYFLESWEEKTEAALLKDYASEEIC